VRDCGIRLKMALKILDTCVNCDVCEPVCPNQGEPGALARCVEAHLAPASDQPWMAGLGKAPRMVLCKTAVGD